MSTRAQKTVALLAIATCLTVPRSARAQTARAWDVYGGYSYLRDSTQDLSLSAGWVASTAFRLNRWFAVVADAGGNYRTLPLVGGDLRVTAHSVMAGGRASAKLGSFVEFVQIVAGPLYTHGTVFGLTTSDTHMAAQAGIGLDVPLRSKLVGRVQLDGRLLSTGHEFRISAGVAYVSR